MNWDMIEGNIKQFSGKIKEGFGKLTDDDITQTEGRRDALVGRIQERYGYAKDQAEKELSRFTDTLVSPQSGRRF